MSDKPEVVSVNISQDKGTVKTPVKEIRIDDRGIVGDAHADPWHRQVSLLATEDIESFAAETGKDIAPGEFAENITITGLDLGSVSILDRFRIGKVELEVSQIGKKCHGAGCAIYQTVGKCVMPNKGLFTRVIHGGKIRPSDPVEYIPKVLRFVIITLSDRAFAGEYSDRSGPKAEQIVKDFFAEKRWHLRIDTMILPDQADPLKKELRKAIDEYADVIFTLGGTGIGPRDITPETVTAVCNKTVPGIMENIRLKFGSAKPSALLSRSVAGIAGKTQVYALPGSVRAVTEYLEEILKTLEHSIFMIHGLDIHDHMESKK